MTRQMPKGWKAGYRACARCRRHVPLGMLQGGLCIPCQRAKWVKRARGIASRKPLGGSSASQ